MALVGLILFAGAVVYLSHETLNLIIAVAIVAYILSPVVNFFVRKLHMGRGFAVVLAYLILIILIIILLVLIVPVITGRIQGFLSTDWPTVINSIDSWLEGMIRQLEVQKIQIGNVGVDLSVPLIELRGKLNSINVEDFNISSIIPDISSAWQSIISVSANLISRILGGLLTIVTSIMISIHLCRDGWKLKDWIVKQFPENYQIETDEFLNRLGNIWNSYFVGELKLMLIIGIVTFGVCTALGLHWALPLGIVAGFLEVIPNIGPIISCIPAIFSAAIFGSYWLPLDNFLMVLVVIIAYILIQQIENIIVVPRVMSHALDIHPVLIIIGILILNKRIGLFGALLAAPILGLLKVTLHFVTCKIRNEDPYPELYNPPSA
jgi:predicted PurR-regulated permease PerM